MPRGICVTGDLPIIQVDGPFSSITASPTKKHPQFAAQNATGASTCTFVLKGSRQKTANKGRRNSAARGCQRRFPAAVLPFLLCDRNPLALALADQLFLELSEGPHDTQQQIRQHATTPPRQQLLLPRLLFQP
jgi:hypothetical protein